jgi:hypothetical protein
MNRRGFLKTLGAAIAVGFAKVETAVLESPSPRIPFAEWVAQPSTLSFHGIPFHCDDAVSSGVWMGINRDVFRLDPYVDVNAPFPPRAFEGASGDPTSDS